MIGPRIPRPRASVLEPGWAESVLLPLVLTFAVGVLLGLACQDRRLLDERDEARAAALQAQRRAAAAHHLAGQWAAACSPVMSLPIESMPEVIPSAASAGRAP